MNRNSQEQAVDLLARIDATDLWDHYETLTPEELAKECRLDEDIAHIVWYNIQSRTDGKYSLYSLCFNRAEEVANMIGEALHQGLDGWTPYQQMVIEAFLADIAYAVTLDDDDDKTEE